MNTLAIETSGSAGSVAALQDSNVLAEVILQPDIGSARSLAPSLKRLLDRVGWQTRHVGLVAVTVGPGSFTGLRIGVTTAKAFAYSAGAEVLGIDTLETLANGVPAELQRVSPAIDAQRGDVVFAEFARNPAGWMAPVAPARLTPIEDWLRTTPPGLPIAGPIVKRLAEKLPATIEALSPEYWQPRAAVVGQLAARDYAMGRRESLWELLPRYSRRSAAEEKWEAKGHTGRH